MYSLQSGAKRYPLPLPLKIDMVRGWITVGNGDLYDFGFTVHDIEKHGVQLVMNDLVILEITDSTEVK